MPMRYIYGDKFCRTCRKWIKPGEEIYFVDNDNNRKSERPVCPDCRRALKTRPSSRSAKEGHSGRLRLVAMVTTIAANMLFLPIAGWAAFGEPVIGRAYLSGIEEAMQFNPGIDFSVIFLLSILLAFVGNVLLGIAIWRSRTLPKWSGAIWIAWAVMFYIAGVLYGLLFVGSSPPTQPVGAALLAISGGWVVWSVFRQPSPATLKQQEV
jgi:hypothetical protein